MGGWLRGGPVSLIALSIATAARPAVAAALDPQQQDELPAAAPAAGQEAAEPQPESVAPPEPGEPAQDVTETIVVTGSRIPRPNLTAVSPVTVIGQAEAQLEGAILAEELLNNLPQVAPSQGAFISNGATGTATVNLRNLGPQRTLVLINGRRLGPGDPFTPVPDLNTIPNSLVKRVEVLTGGASSVYGSDAVSGVVNFILDTRLDGLRIDGQASVFQHKNRNGSGLREALEARGIPSPSGNVVDGGRQTINVAYGKGFFDDRAHVTLYAGYHQIAAVTQAARDYSACSATVRPEANTILFCGGSFASYPGNVFTNFGPLQIGPDRTFVRGVNRFNFGPWNYWQRPDRRYTAGGFADFDISAALQPYAEVMWMDDRSVSQIAPSANFGNTSTINCDNPLLSAQQRSRICVNGNFFGQNLFFDRGNVEIIGQPIPFVDPVTGATYFKANAFVLRRGVESGGRQEDLRHKTIRLVGGFKGEIARGVAYDASYVFGRNKLSSAYLNDFSVSRLTRALDVITDPATGRPACRSALTGEDPECVPWDIFALGAVTPEATAYLNRPSFSNGSVSEKVANVNSTINLDEWRVKSPWSDESPAINFGAEYRKDNLDYQPGELAQSGDLAGFPSEVVPISGLTEVKELFAEARIPLIAGKLIEGLAFEGGYRQSWYRAGEASFATSAYKLALDLTAVRGLRLRASQQRAVRAPNIIELFYPPVTDVFFHDPCEGASPQATQAQCALTGVLASQYGRIIPNQGFVDYNAIAGGNQDLQPELGTTRAIGVVLEPRFLRGFNFTLDWWNIRLDDAVSSVSGDTIIETCARTGDPVFCGRIHRDSNGTLWLSPDGFIDTKLLNIGSIEVRGIDIGVNYRHGLGRFGSATAEFLGTYLDKYVVDNGGLTEPFECAGLFGGGCGNPTPRWRHKARLTWESHSGISLSFHWRHTGSMKLRIIPALAPSPGPFSSRMPARSFFDVAALFRIQRQYVLRIGVNNFFDTEPPILPSGEGAGAPTFYNGNTYPQWYDPLGRFFFAGFTVNF